MTSELHNDSELEKIDQAIVIGFLYGIQADILGGEERDHRVAGFRHTKGYKEAKQALQAHIQAKVKEAVDTALKYPDHLLESDRTRPLYKGKFYENQRALNSMDSKRMRMWIILNG